MNPAEALALTRFVKGACPQQAIDEYTPDAWHALLEPWRFEDCRQAVVDIARTQPFIAPSEIIARVKQIRGKRIAEYGPLDPPADCEDYRAWLGDIRRRIGDGELTAPERPAIDPAGQRKVALAISGTFRSADDAPPARAQIRPAPADTATEEDA